MTILKQKTKNVLSKPN